ncbi:MAG TPA: PilZ domain-containing protein [Planctomycetota bacterium]|nr:PilZ domain-containing protein [Planctomycetota bacterium]
MSVREPEEPTRETCFAERRKNRRLRVRLDIVVRQHVPDGLPGAVEQATTRNVSSGDLYFESSLGDRLHIGDVVDVDIELPARSSTIFSEKHLATRGRVVRLGLPSIEEPNRRGVAIVFLEPPAFHTVLD